MAGERKKETSMIPRRIFWRFFIFILMGKYVQQWAELLRREKCRTSFIIISCLNENSFSALSLRGVRNERRSNPLTFQEITSAKLVLSLSKETPRNDSRLSN